jgi:hypothetical protein
MPTGIPPRPNGNTYWVVPHKFLAGEYPGDKDPVKARKKIRQFLAAGIRHFVDLTEVGDQLAPYEAILSEVVACWMQEQGRKPDVALAELNAEWSTVEKIFANRNGIRSRLGMEKTRMAKLEQSVGEKESVRAHPT